MSTHRQVVLVAVSALLAQLITGCSQPMSAQTGGDRHVSIAVSGAFALYPMVVKWGEEFHTQYPGVQFDVSAGGAGKGMADTLSGAVDIGMVSREVKTEEIDQGAFAVAVVKDAVFPVVNAKNPVLQDLLSHGVAHDVFVDVFITGKIKTWGEVVGKPEIKDEIHVYTRSDAAGAADTWAAYLGKKQEDLLGIGVYGDPGIMDAVVKDPLGIGYNNLSYAFDTSTGNPVAGAAIVPLDKNDNGTAGADEMIDTKTEAVEAVASGVYPAPPSRALNLGNKEKPSGLGQALLLWVLTDGQKVVDSACYIALPQAQLDEAVQKLK